MLANALEAAGIKVSLVDHLSDVPDDQSHDVVIADLKQADEILKARDQASFQFLPVLLRPTRDELAEVRHQYGHALVAPGRLGQAVAVLEEMCRTPSPIPS
ncbi:MAG: hypothetical protein R3E12_18480 [Candidatus Eisenbacteria bacterium]